MKLVQANVPKRYAGLLLSTLEYCAPYLLLFRQRAEIERFFINIDDGQWE